MAETRPKATQVEGLADLAAIVGEVRWVAFAAAPSGWLACDGSVVLQATYPDLYAAIGTTWNTGGELGTEFRLPDFRGRSPVGAGTGVGLTARAVGQTGGEEAHQLSIGELPSHNHPGGTLSGGNVTIPRITPGPTGFYGLREGTDLLSSENYGVSGSLSVAAQGSDGFHNTMHPFGVLLPIIKT